MESFQESVIDSVIYSILESILGFAARRPSGGIAKASTICTPPPYLI
jgi:hypothetical protein